MANIQFHPTFVFRSPLFSLTENINSVDQLKIICENKTFQEAIYIASPVLYDGMIRWNKNEIAESKEIEKLYTSVYKYFTRMKSRCTPFGLFALCATGNWNIENKIILSERRKRQTRLDMGFVWTLVQHLAKYASIQSRILFYPNTSIYTIGNQLRYVEYTYSNNKRTHAITSVDSNEYLSKILRAAKNGASKSELIKLLMIRGIVQDEASSFVQEIIASQLLVNELEPSVTGEDFISQLLVLLNKLNNKIHNSEISNLISLFEKTDSTLKQMDQQTGNGITIYRELVALLNILEISIEENHLFQVDSFSGISFATIDKTIQTKILDTIDFLNYINKPNPNSDLEDFKLKFYEKYENKEMRLAEILDTETGIGYPSKDISGLNNLIDDLQTTAEIDFMPLKWNNKENYLLRKLTQALYNRESVVQFTEREKHRNHIDGRIAPTLSIMFKIINSNKGKIHLNNISGGGSSAANLLGRFAYGDENIHEIIKDITAFEQKIFSDKIIAEIVHWPESHIGNILQRPILREFEIPYLAKSAVSFENQISLEDLFVSVKNNRIILWSKRLNKEIIPRLSTAHNFKFNSLPVYKFLCDLQTQDIEKTSLTFNWGSLSHAFSFLPRAEYKDVILFPATWNLSSIDFSELCKNIYSKKFVDEVKVWKEKWKMPSWIVLKDGDNKLLVDFENELSIKTFFNEIKNRKTIQLSEFLFDPENALIRDEKGNPYNNEIIAIVFNHDYKPSETIVFPEKTSSENTIPVKRSFIPGSEWLYYKIYCGVKTADDILRDTIKPLIENLSRNGLIEKWFFIRYADPDIHIRLRFYNSDASKLNEVMKLMNSDLQQMHEQGVISKIMTDTYNRELERYGHNTMEISEKLFEIDSWATLNLLQLAQGETADELKWQYAIRSLDSLMDCFGFDIPRKLNLMETLKTNFIAEHSTSKDLKVQLDNKFRKMRPQLNELFSKDLSDANNKWSAKEILIWKNASIQTIIDQILNLEKSGELMVNLNDLISSYMHMCINRIFKSQQRKYEMVIYDQLYRYYKSKIAREKASLTQVDS